MQAISPEVKLVLRDDPQWERVVFAEVLVPGVANVFGDFWTVEAIKEAAYMFMETGFGIDLEHDNVDVTGPVRVVESFLVREGDPDFIVGSWVVGMRIHDDTIWQAILDNELNGYSYEAVVSQLSATISVVDNGVRTGLTEPDLLDGHTHYFMVKVDATNRPTAGGTSETNGHSHAITVHTLTNEAAGHTHRYNLVTGKDGK